MKASKFTDAQKAFIIRQGEEGTPVADLCRQAGISQATYFNWKKRYGGLMPSEMRRLRELEGREQPLDADRCGPFVGQGDASRPLIVHAHLVVNAPRPLLVRYGYRRVHFLLRREGWVINGDTLHLCWRGNTSLGYTTSTRFSMGSTSEVVTSARGRMSASRVG